MYASLSETRIRYFHRPFIRPFPSELLHRCISLKLLYEAHFRSEA
jgi:hypothetical protein